MPRAGRALRVGEADHRGRRSIGESRSRSIATARSRASRARGGASHVAQAARLPARPGATKPRNRRAATRRRGGSSRRAGDRPGRGGPPAPSISASPAVKRGGAAQAAERARRVRVWTWWIAVQRDPRRPGVGAPAQPVDRRRVRGRAGARPWKLGTASRGGRARTPHPAASTRSAVTAGSVGGATFVDRHDEHRASRTAPSYHGSDPRHPRAGQV